MPELEEIEYTIEGEKTVFDGEDSTIRVKNGRKLNILVKCNDVETLKKIDAFIDALSLDDK